MPADTRNAPDWLLVKAGATFRLGSGVSVEKEHLLFSTLCMFINEHRLSHQPIELRELSAWEGFELRQSHLTEMGNRVMKEGLTRWLMALDRGTAPEKSKILQKALAKCQSQS